MFVEKERNFRVICILVSANQGRTRTVGAMGNVRTASASMMFASAPKAGKGTSVIRVCIFKYFQSVRD